MVSAQALFKKNALQKESSWTWETSGERNKKTESNIIVLNRNLFSWLNSFASKVKCDQCNWMQLDSFTFDYDGATECRLNWSHLDCTNAIAFNHNDTQSMRSQMRSTRWTQLNTIDRRSQHPRARRQRCSIFFAVNLKRLHWIAYQFIFNCLYWMRFWPSIVTASHRGDSAARSLFRWFWSDRICIAINCIYLPLTARMRAADTSAPWKTSAAAGKRGGCAAPAALFFI